MAQRAKCAMKTDGLRKIIEPAVQEIGLRLWGVEYHGGRHAGGVLQIFIDSEKGVDVEDCVRASRWLGELLDVEWPQSSAFRLEVSSPGLDRPLYTLDQYRSFVGHKIRLQVRIPRDGQRNFRGVLVAVQDPDTLVLEDADIQDVQHIFIWDEVYRGRLDPEF